MRKVFVTIFIAVFIAANAQVKYNDQDFADIGKMAEKIADVNAKYLIKDGVKKVMVMEFFGEFVTSKEVSPSAFEKMNSNWYTEQKSNIEMGSDYYESITNLIFEKVKKVMNDNGIEVLNKDSLINNPDYISLGLKQEKTGKQYTGGVGKQSTSSEVLKRSVSGMGMFSETLQLMAINKINSLVPKIANDNNCQGAIKVKFRIGLGKKGTPTIDYINVTLDSKIDSYKAGKDKVTYYFKNGGNGICSTKKGLITDADITGSEKGTVDVEKYNAVLLKMADAMCNSYSYLIKQEISKK
jgi:hypothetical protein